MQFGGQTPLNLAPALKANGREHHRHVARKHRSGRGPKAFADVLDKIGLKQPANRIALNDDEALDLRAAKSGFPVLLRPCFVLGGRGMVIVYDEEEFERFVARPLS